MESKHHSIIELIYSKGKQVNNVNCLDCCGLLIGESVFHSIKNVMEKKNGMMFGLVITFSR